MRVRHLSNAKAEPYDLAVEKLKQCNALVEAYVLAQRNRDRDAALSARLQVSLFALPGIYVRGDDPERKDMIVVYGVKKTRALVHRERVFYVPYAKLGSQTMIEGGWNTIPLIDTDGFLMPVCRDGYRGARFVRIGDLLH